MDKAATPVNVNVYGRESAGTLAVLGVIRERVPTMYTTTATARARNAAAAPHKGVIAAPAIHFFNFASPRTSTRRPVSRRDLQRWIERITVLRGSTPSAPILVAADVAEQKDWVERALAAGATEVINADELGVRAVVVHRVDHALAELLRGADNATATGESFAAPALLPVRPAKKSPSAPHSAETLASAKASQRAAIDAVHTQSAQRASLVSILAPTLRGKDGRLDAERVVAWLKISLRDLASAIGVSHQALSKTPTSPSAQDGLVPFARLHALLGEMLTATQTSQWLRSPQDAFAGRTPLELIVGGQINQVVRALAPLATGGVD
jgi:hypothetical protein